MTGNFYSLPLERMLGVLRLLRPVSTNIYHIYFSVGGDVRALVLK